MTRRVSSHQVRRRIRGRPGAVPLASLSPAGLAHFITSRPSIDRDDRLERWTTRQPAVSPVSLRRCSVFVASLWRVSVQAALFFSPRAVVAAFCGALFLVFSALVMHGRPTEDEAKRGPVPARFFFFLSLTARRTINLVVFPWSCLRACVRACASVCRSR